MEINHFGHDHPLSLIQSEEKLRRKYRKNIICNGCEKLCTFPLYACAECSFYLHKSCAELPEEFQNPFHSHPLTLVFDVDISFACQACFKRCNGIHFHCEVCNIDLDVDCALLKPTVEEGSKQLQHYTHFHPLALVELEDHIEVTRRIRCLVCGEHCLGPCYGCEPCGVFLHQPCAEFEYEPEIWHYIHPCSLALQTRVHSFRCGDCDTSMLGICYHCELCKFSIDVECALLRRIESKDQTQIKHFFHQHPLFKLDDDDEVNCFACGKNCSGRPIYVCSQLEFALHEYCASVPPKIYDLLHPQHPLTLVVRTTEEYTTQEGFRCNVCCDDCNDLTYRCAPCNFNLHERCCGLLPTIKYDGHRHLLLYVEKIDLEGKCNACGGHCDSSLLRCPQCNFNLHLRCSPLPYTIKHNCHIDSLLLKDSPPEDEIDYLILKEFLEDDSDEEFYCNACEEKREPRYPIYYCADCPFVAEVSCVTDEVKRWLEGEYGDVDLKTPEGKIAGKVISKWQEVDKICKTEAARATSGHRSRPFTEEELKELEHILSTKVETSSAEKPSFDELDNLDISIYWDKEYQELLQKLDSSQAKDYMEFWEEKEELVKVWDYLVPESLVPILESLFAKYGDIGVDTKFHTVETFLFVILCRTIDSMCNTRVLDISEGQLINWWKYLKALQSAGFKIQFALDRLHRVMRDYIGLQLKERVKNRSYLDEEISKKSDEVKKLEEKLEALEVRRKQISEESVRLRISVRKSSTAGEYLREVTKLKWRKAGEGLQPNKLS